ncbi:MAG TPA: DUF433 domain-containing protein [Dehalococcoidia bacterium]|nr:DUF433 domain-containing protein [Dehalococcoidia bacterium]
MAKRKPIVHCDPGILGGTPVFVGTRVPVTILFEWLEAGHSLDYWLDNFPSVKRSQAVAALEFGRDALIASAQSYLKDRVTSL